MAAALRPTPWPNWHRRISCWSTCRSTPMLFDAGDDVEHTYLPCGPTQGHLAAEVGHLGHGQEIRGEASIEERRGAILRRRGQRRFQARLPRPRSSMRSGRARLLHSTTARLEDIKTRQPAVADLFDPAPPTCSSP
ncbi:hypothetical protein ACRAWD_12825 [Caulobacter segnis]